MKPNVGDTLAIHCYKHDGGIYKIWDKALVLDVKEDYMVLGNDNVLVTKKDGRIWRTKEPAIMFFYYNRWFNVTAQLKSGGIFFKGDIASPFIIDNRIIKFIDYDLDLKVFPDGAFKILDRNEYNYHKKIMNYPKEIDFIIKSELSSLIEIKKQGEFPFDKNVVDEYFKVFLKLIN